MSWRKTLSLVGSLAGVGASALVGCLPRSCGSGRVVREGAFPFMPDQEIELCGTKRLAELRGTWTRVSFAEPLRFHDTGETIDATGYVVITFLDGQVFGGKYAMKATYLKGDSGGPAGFVNSYSVEYEGVHLVERLVKPQAPAGVRALLPGEFVVRKVVEGELPRVFDRYVVELPARKQAFMIFEPYPSDYPFQVNIIKDGVLLPKTINENAPSYARGYRFDTSAGGLFHFTVQGVVPTGKIPDRYQFRVGWGDSLDRTSSFEDKWVEFKDPPAFDGNATNQNHPTKGE